MVCLFRFAMTAALSYDANLAAEHNEHRVSRLSSFADHIAVFTLHELRLCQDLTEYGTRDKGKQRVRTGLAPARQFTWLQPVQRTLSGFVL